jgi:hypothetical protein
VFAAAGCDPYKDYKLKGEFNAGSVDPVNFAQPYRGAGSTRNIAGSGTGFSAVRAYAQGAAVEYFLFPFAPSQVVRAGYTYTTASASFVRQQQNALTIRQFPNGYIFDPPSTRSAFPDQQQCRAPDGYQFDPRRDDVHYDEQGEIFTALPDATWGSGSLPTWNYVPIVQEVPVGSAGEPCQEIKSERTLLTRSDVNVPRDSNGGPLGDGRYLAWALIDPGSGVYRVGESTSGPGLGIQRWGWFQRFLVAYIDGGYIPLNASATQFVAQNLYVPSRVQVQSDPGTTTASGKLGAGYDVLDFPRGDPRYSPICRVLIYNTGTAGIAPGSLRSAAAINTAFPPPYANPPAVAADSIAPSDVIPPYVFCLQAQ